MTKKIIFELEVEETFNVYKFFKFFKKLQFRGLFKDVIRVSRLDEKGKSKEMKLSHIEEQKEEQFIVIEQYGVK